MADAIFILKQTIGKHREEPRHITVTYIDLENMRLHTQRGDTEMLKGTKCAGKVQANLRHIPWIQNSSAGESNSFTVAVGLHQSSALSPYLFLLLIDVLTADVRKNVPGSLMFADDIMLCGANETDMTEYLETWMVALGDIGMRFRRPKNLINRWPG